MGGGPKKGCLQLMDDDVVIEGDDVHQVFTGCVAVFQLRDGRRPLQIRQRHLRKTDVGFAKKKMFFKID